MAQRISEGTVTAPRFLSLTWTTTAPLRLLFPKSDLWHQWEFDSDSHGVGSSELHPLMPAGAACKKIIMAPRLLSLTWTITVSPLSSLLSSLTTITVSSLSLSLSSLTTMKVLSFLSTMTVKAPRFFAIL
ncbi:MAG: hypothetical protein MPK06_04655 [Alphaproteobacteria bacterium]|nr:hypothetical protein [Alphaproteobacteria bacterium]MDA8005811.1 hypothetical protein [Alphaproteobacteria bacterium]MDA8013537.1 hypothetical protein [Alphaproteobacteria bacterium]